MFAIDICITRIASNSYRFNGYGQFSSGSTGTLTMDWNDVLLTPPIAYTTWEMKLGYYYLGVNIARPITETLTCDLIVDTTALIAAPPAPTSHTAYPWRCWTYSICFITRTKRWTDFIWGYNTFT
jgi:hypothetical protein